jgi:threonine dehydratase
LENDVTPPTHADVVAAAGRLAGQANRTPVLSSRTADQDSGATFFFKCENLQRVGAFKFRGAFNALCQFSVEQRRRGVVAFSTGNHAQAVALSARMLGIPAVIVMPHDAPRIKTTATRGYGAEVVFYDRVHDDREKISDELVRTRGLTLLPPYDHPDIIAGQGTAALELFDEVGPLDYLFVPVGGGGLLAGSLLAASASSASCQVFGVEPEAGNDGQQSLRAGQLVRIATPATIADGAQTQCLGKLPFQIIKERAADILTATDAQLVARMRFLSERMKLIVEPTGCLGYAGALASGLPLRGKRVGVILSGGNIDLAVFGKLLAEAELQPTTAA